MRSHEMASQRKAVQMEMKTMVRESEYLEDEIAEAMEEEGEEEREIGFLSFLFLPFFFYFILFYTHEIENLRFGSDLFIYIVFDLFIWLWLVVG